jgi:hypothetical protein
MDSQINYWFHLNSSTSLGFFKSRFAERHWDVADRYPKLEPSIPWLGKQTKTKGGALWPTICAYAFSPDPLSLDLFHELVIITGLPRTDTFFRWRYVLNVRLDTLWRLLPLGEAT